MSSRYRLTEQAREDVIAIWEHIAADSVEAADRLVDQLTATYAQLAKSPRIGADLSRYRPDLRSFPVRKYVIFFAPTSDGIEVYPVLHGARGWQSMIVREDWPDSPVNE